jgi:ABC-2 type transport system permease protein
VAYLLPSSHAFEGMRAVLIEHSFRMDLLLTALALNVIYLALGIAAFLAFFNIARTRGQLLQVGE